MTEDDRLRGAFLAKQRHLLAALEIVPEFTPHGTTLGDDSEANWARVLREFLPGRYGVAKGHVMDSRGATSDQIDLLVYDAQYTPLLAQTSSGDLFIPAEAVYAVFEVKQEMNKTFMEYAGSKIESVRKLHRTTKPIPYAGGIYPPKPPTAILGGLLTTRNGWADLAGVAAVNAVLSLSGDREINFGCALRSLSFHRPDDPAESVEFSESDTTLLFFLFRLFTRLQGLGTVAAVDIGAYMNHLDLSAAPVATDGEQSDADSETRG